MFCDVLRRGHQWLLPHWPLQPVLYSWAFLDQIQWQIEFLWQAGHLVGVTVKWDFVLWPHGWDEERRNSPGYDLECSWSSWALNTLGTSFCLYVVNEKKNCYSLGTQCWAWFMLKSLSALVNLHDSTEVDVAIPGESKAREIRLWSHSHACISDGTSTESWSVWHERQNSTFICTVRLLCKPELKFRWVLSWLLLRNDGRNFSIAVSSPPEWISGQPLASTVPKVCGSSPLLGNCPFYSGGTEVQRS